MRVTLINTTDTVGGASIACRRLLTALHNNGTQATMLVKEQYSDNPLIQHVGWQNKLREAHHAIEKLGFLPYERDKSVRFSFSTAILGLNIAQHEAVKSADILHLHWVNKGFLSLHSLEQLAKTGKPIFWTLHDMWTFTGGCHYANECRNYQNQCGQCTAFLKQPAENDLSHQIWLKKRKIFAKMNLHIVTCSEWLGAAARSASLLRDILVTAIPNPIDTNKYTPATNKTPRTDGKKTILFQAMNVNDERKGFKYLLEALVILRQKHPNIASQVRLLVFGKSKPETFAGIDIPVETLGLLHSEEAIIAAYQQADVFVIPSLEENLPNTIMESLACGVPVVAFGSGGIPEMVKTGYNGYLANTKNAADLADGIAFTLDNPHRQQELARHARQKALDEYAEKVVAARYQKLYTDANF